MLNVDHYDSLDWKSGMGEEEEEVTHLCDTCKYREEECKPRNARIVGGDVTQRFPCPDASLDVVLAFNLFGDSLRDYLDPRFRV